MMSLEIFWVGLFWGIIITLTIITIVEFTLDI